MVRWLTNWGPSTVYEVYYPGWDKPVEVRINSALFARAKRQYSADPESEHEADTARVCIQIRKALNKQFNADIYWVNYGKCKFKKLRDLPAGA